MHDKWDKISISFLNLNVEENVSNLVNCNTWSPFGLLLPSMSKNKYKPIFIIKNEEKKFIILFFTSLVWNGTGLLLLQIKCKTFTKIQNYKILSKSSWWITSLKKMRTMCVKTFRVLSKKAPKDNTTIILL